MGFLMLIYHLLAKGALPLTKNYSYLYLLVGVFKYIKQSVLTCIWISLLWGMKCLVNNGLNCTGGWAV